MSLGALLLLGCSPLHTINPLKLRQAGLTELDDDMFQAERKQAHAQFAQRVGSRFEIIGKRDFVLEDENAIANASDALRKALHQDENEAVVRRCKGELSKMDYGPLRTKMYWRNERCHYVIDDMPPDVTLGNTQEVLVVLYDVAVVRPDKN